MPTAEELRDASGDELKLLGAAAAERGVVFCRFLGSDEQQDWLSGGLDLVWAAASDEAAADDCLEHLDALEAEDAEGQDEEHDSTERPGFYADQAVGLVAEALVGSADPSTERVERALRTLRTLCSMVVFKLGGEVPVVVRSGDSRPAPGPLVRRELDAEHELAALLTRARGASGNAASVDEIRAAAQEFAREVTSAVREFAEASGWR
ncbi:hypothetical protein [Streptomyces sp. MA15]|uniref:hypothetical protein n=1 Tax=Streptomyces sp. MA15 TaxID=3055061 RepID=UPI0025B03E43|nr:hypothetical protein [Streptomyces sp. MA15]MDN3271432.1 hypothetical protein [Streptomyces sp. MA15]